MHSDTGLFWEVPEPESGHGFFGGSRSSRPLPKLEQVGLIS